MIFIPRSSRTVGNGNSADFGIGVTNEDPDGDEHEYTVTVNYATSDPSGPPPNWVPWLTPPFQTNVNIKHNEHYTFKQRITPKGAKRATYVFNVAVCTSGTGEVGSSFCPGNQLYGSIQKIYLTVG